jgi:uncharacterized membrane protein
MKSDEVMSVLAVVTFGDEFRAEMAYKQLVDMEYDYMLDLDDAVVIRKKPNGRIKYHHEWNTWDKADEGALGGGIWGSLLGLLIGGPYGFLIGGAGGALLGGTTASLVDYGIERKFVEEVSGRLKAGSSAIFVLVRHREAERVLMELGNLGGKLHITTLTPENEKHLLHRFRTRKRAA